MMKSSPRPKGARAAVCLRVGTIRFRCAAWSGATPSGPLSRTCSGVNVLPSVFAHCLEQYRL